MLSSHSLINYHKRHRLNKSQRSLLPGEDLASSNASALFENQILNLAVDNTTLQRQSHLSQELEEYLHHP